MHNYVNDHDIIYEHQNEVTVIWDLNARPLVVNRSIKYIYCILSDIFITIAVTPIKIGIVYGLGSIL